LMDKALDIKIATIGGEFKGTLDGKTLTGEWSQPGMPMPAPLVLTQD
jgi:hypothetical protein